MKRLTIYDSLGLISDDDVFGYLTSTFHDNLRKWDYFVNWNKAFSNADKLHGLVEKWDILIGSDDFDADFRELVSSQPELARTIPLLVVRDGSGSTRFSIVSETDATDWRAGLRHFDFSEPAATEAQVELALEFVTRTGLRKIFETGGISNTRDYLLGTEAGLDSNGRKNRGGDAMTAIISRILKDLSPEVGFDFGHELTPVAISKKWGVELDGVPPGRRFDFAVNSRGRIFAIEVNAYGGGGSKLKATAGEYEGLQEQLRGSPITFIWITEGAGWKGTNRPLRKAFDTIDYLLNLRLIEDGALQEILASP